MTTEQLHPTVDVSTVERVLLDGDLAKLTAQQRVNYYIKVCDSVGLNHLTQPFEYITLNGKLRLYARREATEQLRRLHTISIAITARELVESMYAVTARATTDEGRSDENIGVVSLEGLKGEARANAMMKAETKAKRRVTLAICGLGMLDESEVETIPAAVQWPTNSTLTIPAAGGGVYETTTAPPPGADAPLPPVGFVLIARIDSAPTKKPGITRFRITTSTGEYGWTISELKASLADQYLKQRTPCRVRFKSTPYGPELDVIGPADEPELPISEPLTADDLPF